jgi:hypothetical protein
MRLRIAILVLLLWAAPAGADYPTMTSTNFAITSCEFSSFGKYKSSAHFDTWDSGGQPSFIGAWPDGGATGGINSGEGWAYTINLPIFWDKDHDQDGMPLTYEEESGFSGMNDFNAADAFADPDGDGFTNIQEYLARTNPNDPTSFFQFTDIRIVNSGGEPALYWVDPTVSITGFESEWPQYARSLRFDVLYADWPVSSQADGHFPNEDWFNQTGTWHVLGGGTNLYRDPASSMTSFTATFSSLSSLADRDIRFFRLAIGGTAFEGEPVVGPSSYTTVGDKRIASTMAKEVLMIQKHGLNNSEYPVFGLAGDITGGGAGNLNYALGTLFLPAGSAADYGTNLNLWVAGGGGTPDTSTVDFLSSIYHSWRQTDQTPSDRAIIPEDGFRLVYKDGLPASTSLYLGSQLKMDSYYHDIYRRVWNDQTSGPDDDTNAQITFLSYNFPVAVDFFNSGFPTMAGTSNPSITGWEGMESDWVILYERDLTGLGEGASENTIVYFDHGPDDRWEYFAPLNLMGHPVEPDELFISPGSPFIAYQYWNPADPVVTPYFLFEADVPYQAGGANTIKTYLKFQ